MPILKGYARTRRFVIVLALAAVAVAWLLAASWLWSEHRKGLAAAGDEVSRMSMVAAEQTRRLFSLTNLFMDSLEELLALDESGDPTADPVIVERVNRLSAETDGAIEIAFADRAGLQRILPAPADQTLKSVADRDYVRDARTGINTIGLPVRGRTSGEWIIPVSRRLRHATASAEVITAVIHLPALEALYAGITRSRGGGVGLLRSDGIMLARAPLLDDKIGTSFAAAPLFTQYLPKAPSGIFTRLSAVDGTERITAYQSVPSLDLVVSVSLTTEAALEEWRRLLWVGGGLTLLITALTAFAAALILRLLGTLEQGAATLDQKVRDRTNDLEGLMEARSAFLTSVSHELRTPLNAIIGFSDALLSGICGPVPGNQAEYLGDIHRSGHHLLALVNDLLDSAAIDSGRLRLDEESVPVAEIITEAIAMIRQRAESASLYLDTRVAPDGLCLRGDRRRLLQALLNLCTNAVKYNRTGSWIRVHASVQADGSCLISVADNGIGMTDEELKLALMPYGRAISPGTKAVEGTGLGLPLTANIIALHGGTLWLESVRDRGTAAHIRLPAARVVPTDEEAKETEALTV